MARVVKSGLSAIVLLAAVATPPLRLTTHSAADVSTSVTVVNNDAAGHQLSRFAVDGNAIDAHDGSILKVGDVFYLYGTAYDCGYQYGVNSQFCGFKVYSSPDLMHWTYQGYVVAPSTCSGCFRPQVVFNATTGKYVLWANMSHVYEVYTSPGPTGPFTFVGDVTTAVGQHVDLSLYVDDDGTGYLIHNTTLVSAGNTADMAVEQLTPDYLGVTGAHVQLGLGNVEAFTVFKRDGVYHALMSDPTCAYCAGATGEMTATSMLGPWSGRWWDPNGWNNNANTAQPRYRARIVNADNCGGQPLASLAVQQSDGSTTYLFVSDRWNNRAPNEGLANLYIGPMSFDSAGTLQNITCVNSFTINLPVTAGRYTVPPDQDQTSGFDGFRHYCDIAGNVQRQQTFTAGHAGTLSTVTVTSMRSGNPGAPLLLDVLDGPAVLARTAFAAPTVSWAPQVLTAHPDVAVNAGHVYTLRLYSTASTGCYGFEYNDANPYPGGGESYSTNTGTSFTTESARDIKFTTEVSQYPVLLPEDLPPGFAHCAGQAGTCTVSDTRVVAYGAGAYRYQTATGGVSCTIPPFGGDPAVGVLKSCYVAPLGGPTGWSNCSADGGVCTVSAPTMAAYGANGAFTYRLLSTDTSCDSATWGDPMPGVTKACYLAPAGAPSGGWTQCAVDGATCTVAGTQTVAFGAAGAFVSRLASASAACAATTFGTDPLPGVAKACYLRTGAPSGFPTRCAGESGTCTFSGLQTVAFGAAGRFAYKSFTGSAACTTGSFGTDPINGVTKSCYLAG